MGRLDTDYIKNKKPDDESIADVPATLATRWVPRRKAQVVQAVRCGALSLDEACHRYALTLEEFRSWQQAIEKHGLPGLRATHARDHHASK